jgi:hypothetical protein
MFLTDWAFGSRAGPQEKMKELKGNKHPDGYSITGNMMISNPLFFWISYPSKSFFS